MFVRHFESKFAGGEIALIALVAHQVAYAGIELNGRERLGNELIGACLKRLNALGVVHVGCDDQDGDSGGGRVLAQFSSQGQPIDLWHHVIKDDDIGQEVDGLLPGLATVGRLDDIEAFHRFGQVVPQVGGIVRHQSAKRQAFEGNESFWPVSCDWGGEIFAFCDPAQPRALTQFLDKIQRRLDFELRRRAIGFALEQWQDDDE